VPERSLRFDDSFRSPVGIVYGWDYDGIWSSSIPQLSFLINEDILDKCFRWSLSFVDPRISPLTTKYKCPRLSLFIITRTVCSGQKKRISVDPFENRRNETSSLVPLSHADIFKALFCNDACFEHSNLLKVNGPVFSFQFEIETYRRWCPKTKRQSTFTQWRVQANIWSKNLSKEMKRIDVQKNIGNVSRASFEKRMERPVHLVSTTTRLSSNKTTGISFQLENKQTNKEINVYCDHSQIETTQILSTQKFNYELFNCNNFNICHWSWNYRGCWHQTCPPIVPRRERVLNWTHSNRDPFWSGIALLFLVTTSLRQDWVICAPAAFLGSGGRFSGSLSGIEPQFSVTRDHHGRPLSYRRKLIGRKFEWSIVSCEELSRFARLSWITICQFVSVFWEI